MYQNDDSFATGYAVGRDSTNGYNNGWGFGGGWEGLIGLVLVAGLFGGNWGGGMFGNRGTPATQADVRDAVDQQTLISKIDQQTYGMADSFNSLNNAIVGGFNGVNNAICTLGYNQASLVNSLSRELAECCCTTKSAIADVKYANERNTCSIIEATNANTRAILDFLTNEKIEGLRAENTALKGQISNDMQTRSIVNELRDGCPIPAFLTCNPRAPYGYGYGYGYGNNSGCCGASVV